MLPSWDRPGPDRRTATWRPERGGGNDRNRSRGREGTVGCDGRNRRSGTRCRRPKIPVQCPAETGRRARVAMPGCGWGRKALAPNETGTTFIPRGGSGSTSPRRRVPRRSARRRSGGAGTKAISKPRRSGDRTVARGLARERRFQTQRGCEGTIPEGSRGTSSRASACHPVQRPDPRSGAVRGRNQAHPVHESGGCRTGTRQIAGNAEASLAISAFYPTLHIDSLGGRMPPATATST